MKTYSNIDELRSHWSEPLRTALGDNLICAFAHGECLMPGFDARNGIWQISFWLQNNQPEDIAKLKDLVSDPAKSGVRFGYFLTQDIFEHSADVFPLEYLHMSKRHGILVGGCPLEAFVPASRALRLELERELRGLLIHLRREYLYSLATPKQFPRFFAVSLAQAMPLLYGAAFLFSGRYPDSHESALQLLSEKVALDATLGIVLRGTATLAEKEAIALANNYISTLQVLAQAIDQQEIHL